MELENLTAINIEDEMRQSYMDYAMSVIVGRALPDVRDGLKPVQRRVLYAMFREGLLSNRKHSKCAGVVGEVLKKYHPHGDSSVYEALVRLAQPWNLRYTLVDGQGNFGSVDGDPPAAYRYTESRMTALAERLLADIDKETVDFAANFDDTTQEPIVLPSLVPNLLINGANGIAVGMATRMPPHNLTEVINGTIAVIDNPSISVRELLDFIPGPDFPTGGLLYGRGGIASAAATGKGTLHLRARTHFERIKANTREVDAIIVTEIPYQVNKAKLIERIADLVNNKDIEGISRLRDESDRSGMRIVIEVKRDATPEVVLNQLFRNTPMQMSFGVINLAIVEGQPVICSLRDLIQNFVNHRRDVVTRRTQFELRQARERIHILEGFRIALLNLDEVIQLIRKSESGREARDRLMERFGLTQIQAQAILDLRLQKLTGLERLAIENEYNELLAEIERLLAILGDTHEIDKVIKGELQIIRDEYQDARKTEIVDDDGDITIEELIEDEEVAILMSHQGYIKRTAVSEYREQRRGGRGILGASSKDEDFTEHFFVASTLAHVMVFTSLGRLYVLPVRYIPEAGRTARGRALINLCQMKEDEKVTALLPVSEFSEDRYVVMATQQGVVKKVSLGEFSQVRKTGIIACSLDEGDTLIGVGISSGNDDVMLATKNGMANRFREEGVRAMGRTARGVRGINLGEGDEVVSMSVVPPGSEQETDEEQTDEGPTVLSVCENGFGKRSRVSEYRVTNRGGKGIINIQTSERNGTVVGTLIVTGTEGLMLITSGGKIIRTSVAQISITGRNAQGVKLINLDEGEKVLGVALVAASEEDEEGSSEVEQ